MKLPDMTITFIRQDVAQLYLDTVEELMTKERNPSEVIEEYVAYIKGIIQAMKDYEVTNFIDQLTETLTTTTTQLALIAK